MRFELSALLRKATRCQGAVAQHSDPDRHIESFRDDIDGAVREAGVNANLRMPRKKWVNERLTGSLGRCGSCSPKSHSLAKKERQTICPPFSLNKTYTWVIIAVQQRCCTRLFGVSSLDSGRLLWGGLLFAQV
jgi:hypothetical protein